MTNTHDKDASRRTVTRATAIAVAAGLVFTTAQVAQAQDPTESTTAQAVESTTATPAVTPVEAITPVESTAVSVVEAPAVAAVNYPSDWIESPLKVLGVNKDAKPSSSTGQVNWTSNEAKADDTGFITSPNSLTSRELEITLTAGEGLEGFFDRFKDNGESFVNVHALVNKAYATGVIGAVDQPNTDYARVPANDKTSEEITDSLKVEVGEEGRELKISYTTPVNVGAFVSFETPGYYTDYTKDARFDITAEVEADALVELSLLTNSTETVEVKADEDFKAPSNGEAKAEVKVFVNDTNPKQPTGKTEKGTDSELTKDSKFEATGKDKVSIVVKNTSPEVSLPDAVVVLPNGEVFRKEQEIKPGETAVFEHETDLREKDEDINGVASIAYRASQSQSEDEQPPSVESEEPRQTDEATEDTATVYPIPYDTQKTEVKRSTNFTIRPLIAEGKLPEGTEFSLVDDYDGMFDIDSVSGTIAGRIPKDAELGEYKLSVTVTYPDGTSAPAEPSPTVEVVKDSEDEESADNKSESTSESTADQVNKVVEEIGTVLTGILGGLAPVLTVFGAANQSGTTTSTSKTSVVRVTPTNSPNTARSSNSGTSTGSRVASNASARTTNRTTTTRRAATNNSTRTTRTTRTTRATTSSRTASRRLANTGANSWSIAAIALLLIALAGMFLMISRRNREF